MTTKRSVPISSAALWKSLSPDRRQLRRRRSHCGGQVRDSKDTNYGYNAQTDKFEDLVKAGVIDPTKVTRTALQNAASIAALDAHHRSSCLRRSGRKKTPAAVVSTAACLTVDKLS